MAHGIFNGTFYCPGQPKHIEQIDLGLSPQQMQIVNDILASETLTRLDLEFASVGNGLVWNIDQFEMIENKGVADCDILIQHRK